MQMALFSLYDVRNYSYCEVEDEFIVFVFYFYLTIHNYFIISPKMSFWDVVLYYWIGSYTALYGRNLPSIFPQD